MIEDIYYHCYFPDLVCVEREVGGGGEVISQTGDGDPFVTDSLSSSAAVVRHNVVSSNQNIIVRGYLGRQPHITYYSLRSHFEYNFYPKLLILVSNAHHLAP